VTGFRVGELAYLTDVSRIPEETFALLEGVRILVLSALREEPHPTHLTFDQAIEIARRVGAEQTWFTHFAHGLPHATLENRFPATMRPAYDGLKLSFS
jgi:phosphoribosyl 1,2-cyclic phosphate phosphodiesterase